MASAALGTTLRQIHRLLSEGSLAGLSDDQLLARYIGDRDGTAFEAVVARHGPMVVGVCRSILRDEHAAEDAFQATFLVLARKADAISDRDSLGGWLHRVAYRIAVAAGVDRQRRRQVEATASDSRARSEDRGDWHPVLHQEIERLPEVYRVPIVLCYLQELTYEQAAQQLSWTVPTLRCRLAKARGKLRTRLIRRGLTGAVGLVGGLADPRWATAAVPAPWIRQVVSNATGASAVSTTAAMLAGALVRTLAFARLKGVAVIAVTMVSLGLLAATFPGNDEGPAQAPLKELAPRTTPFPVRPTRDDLPGATVEVRGQVVDPAGKPVAGALLGLDHYRWLTKPPIGGEPAAKSGSDGRFTLKVARDVVDRLAQGRSQRACQVIASAPGFSPGWAEPRINSDDLHDVTIRLVEDDLPLEGRVLDLEGRPVAGALIRTSNFFDPLGRDLSPWIEAFKTRANGPYDGLEEMPLKLTRTTGADGRFRLEGIGRERVVMFTIAGPTIELTRGFAMTKDAPPIRAANPQIIAPKTVVYHGRRFDFITAPGRVVSGVVRDQDTEAPLSGVEIHGMAFDPSSRATYREVNSVSDEQGRYRLVGLGQADRYRLFATPGKGQPYPTAGFVAKPQAPRPQPAIIDLKLKRGILVSGRVTDKATGKPLKASVESHALRDNPYAKDFPAVSEAYQPRVFTDEAGRFEVAALPGPGFLSVRADADGYLSAVGAEAIPGMNPRLPFSALPGFFSPYTSHVIAALNSEPGAEPVTCDMQCDPGRSLTGTVVDPAGRPIAGVWAHGLRPVQSTKHPALESHEFQAVSLDPKHPRRLYFFHGGRALAGSVVAKGDEPGPIVVKLQPQGVITGRIVDDDGQPMTGLELLNFVKPEFNPLQGDILPECKVDPEGRFRLIVVPGLEYEATAMTEQPPRKTSQVFEAEKVGPGEIRDLGDLRFEQPRSP